MIYMADHGENPKLGHRPAHFTWDMARIPLWFAMSDDFGERQKFCVHGIIGARQTGASNEHEHQTQFS